MADITLELSDQDIKVEIPEKLIFGRTLSNYVFEIDYDTEKGGWNNPVIKAREKMPISPAAMALHYGQAIFEGLKAFKRVDGSIAMFRPQQNIERMNNSARRLCMPEIDPELFMQALKKLVKLEEAWIPEKPGHSLYIRPVMFAYDPFLGVRPGEQYKFVIMLSPVGPYYPEGFKPVPIMVTDKYVRAASKGVGECKCAGNYAASLMAQAEAKKMGFSQVLWLDGIHQKYVEEVGTMNIFIQLKDEVVTPRLTGTILPGVTRRSVIQILKDWDYNINERDISIDEVADAYRKGSLLEIFGTGTAAVISTLSKLKYNDLTMQFSDTEAGELGKKLYKEITDIQYGRKEDKYNWMIQIS
jgi:branched-chain amino acid aminotransferase